MNPALTELRRKGVALFALACWAAVIALVAMSIGADNRHPLPALIFAILLSAVPTYAYRRKLTHLPIRMALGVVAALMTSMLLYAAQGSVWQIDLHLYFFVGLSLVAMLCDPRAIMAACLVMVFHHAIHGLLAPQWVFWGGTGLWRVLLHFGAVAVSGVVLSIVACSLRDALKRTSTLEGQSESQSRQLADTLAALRDARAEITAERARSEEERDKLIAAHNRDFEAIAADFEKSVNAVTHSVAGTAQLLEQSAHELKLTADQTSDDIRKMVGAAESAGKAANLVAAGVAELSMSISEISVNVGQQDELTNQATERSGGGGEAIGSLTQQSQTIGEATRAIVRIAERTNLLALNAAIEAASAGASGRGFSIVANEVKVLASQAGAAAVQIDAFLKGVRSGTLEAERSFKAIDATIGELGKATTSIRYDVENQRQSADTIESFARGAASDADAMVSQIKALATRAKSTRALSDELDQAAALLAENVRNLEASTDSFTSRLRAA